MATANDPAQDLRLHADMHKAVALDPQDPGKHLQLGKLLARLGQDGSDAFRAALALDPTQPEPLAHLLAPLLAREDWSKALATAEAAAQTAPLVHQHWLAAAEVAALAGRRALAVAHAQRALGLAPALPALHARLAALYLTLGAQTAAAQRNHCADRLRARAAHTEET